MDRGQEEGENDYALGTAKRNPLQTTIAFLQHAKADKVENHVTTIFNPSPMLSEEEVQKFPWQLIDVLIVNEGESIDLLRVLDPRAADKLASLSEGEDKSTQVLQTLSGVSQLSHTAWIVLTRGSKGVMAHILLSPSSSEGNVHSSTSHLSNPTTSKTQPVQETPSQET